MSVSQDPSPPRPGSGSGAGSDSGLGRTHYGSRHEADVYNRIEEGPDFVELRRRFRSFVFPVTAFFLVWYLLYIVCSIWARGFMNTKLLGNINIAYVFGLLQFLSTFIIAWLYWRYSNNNLDPLAQKIRGEVEDLDEHTLQMGRGNK